MGRLIDCDKLCTDLLERWNIADKNREDQIRWLMADVVTPIVACQPTVDAIPINWIMTQVEERVERGTAFDISVASILRTIAKEWRDEQTD